MNNRNKKKKSKMSLISIIRDLESIKIIKECNMENKTFIIDIDRLVVEKFILIKNNTKFLFYILERGQVVPPYFDIVELTDKEIILSFDALGILEKKIDFTQLQISF